MDTEVTRTTAHPGEEFRGSYDAAAIEQILHASLDEQAKSSAADTDEPSLAEQFAGIVYFSEMAAGTQRDPRPAYGRANRAARNGTDTARSARGRRAPVPPWRLPAVTRNAKS
ncbi:hypothetical protein OG984_17220 [Nocardioides sp. NBC_00368]|uniref:hypothetical protein n=1 Tax=Nocardioides sp. NBC_00368 TaxID=2976000 RepID=UPI002E228809